MKKVLPLLFLITIVFFTSQAMAEVIHDQASGHATETMPIQTSGHETEKMQIFQFDFKSAYILEKELETNLFYKYTDSDEEDIHFTLFELEYGVTDRIKLSAEIPYESYEETEIEHDWQGHEEELEISENGLGDIEFVGAYAFIKQNHDLPEAVFGMKVIAPTGDEDKGLGKDVWGWKPFIAASKTWDQFALHGKLAYGIFNNMEGEEHDEAVDEHGHHVATLMDAETDLSEFEFVASAVYMPNEKIDLILEFSGLVEGEDVDLTGPGGKERLSESEDTTFLYLVPGIKYEISKGLEAGVAVPIGLNDDSADWGVMFRINKAFALGGHH